MSKEFYNASEKISASEVNRFTYCPYQWYYERKFGRKHLVQSKKKSAPIRMPKHSVKSSFTKEKKFPDAISNFEKGKKFHNDYVLKFNTPRNKGVRIALFICVAILMMFVVVWVAYL